MNTDDLKKKYKNGVEIKPSELSKSKKNKSGNINESIDNDNED